LSRRLLQWRRPRKRKDSMEALPDLARVSDAELKELIHELEAEENDISYRRRLLHGKLDILRAELVARLQKKGEGELAHVDLDRLTEILAGKAAPPDRECRESRLLPGVRVPLPRVRELLLALRRAPRRGGGRQPDGDDLARRARGGGERARGHRDRGAGPRRALRRRPRGRAVRARAHADDDRANAGLRHLSRRRHRVAPARERRPRRERLHDRGSRQPELHVPEPAPDREGRSRHRRRAPDRQVPPDLPRAMTATAQAPRLHTIGAVCRRLQAEFPDISISKIRYLEDQGLLAPKRTRGGYRLFSEDDVERLETILRLQRDEFLPLRVIRQELAAPAAKDRRRRRSNLSSPDPTIDVSELCERAGITAQQARELVEYGLLEQPFTESDVDTAAVCARLTGAGADVRHLRKFATAAGNQADLLEALVPKLRSRNPEARQGALDDLHVLAELAQELSQLLFWRALRSRVG